MSKLKEKFPLFEFLILVAANIFNNILAVINTFCWILTNSSINGNIGLAFDDILIFTFTMGINIFIPLFICLLVLYHSQNIKFLRLWFTLKNNLTSKIFLCTLLFIISPMPLVTLLLFRSYEQALRDFFLSFPLSMGFPLMLFFIFEPIITKMVDKHFEKRPDSKSWLKKNYDLRMEIQKELSLNN